MWNNPYATTPPVANVPKKFRRGVRVRVNKPGAPYCHGKMGTILNPEADIYPDGERDCTVRMDTQHPWERGDRHREAELEMDTTGERQFDQRRYELRYLSHDDIALLRELLEADRRPSAAGLLRLMPDLPS